MPRALAAVLVIVGCTSAKPTEPRLDDWLDNWVEARRCLADDAEDTATGIEINMLRGLNCARLLKLLDIPDGELVDDMWRDLVDGVRTIDEETSVFPRAAAVDRVDAAAFAMGLAVDHPIPMRAKRAPLSQLAAPWKPFERGVQSYNAGLVQMYSQNTYAVVDDIGNVSVVEVPRSESLALPSREVTVPRRALVASAIGDDRVAVMWPGQGEHYAYIVERSHDGGRRWTRELVLPGGELRRWWQDGRTGEIVLSVEQGGKAYVHALTATGMSFSVETAIANQFDDKGCIRDGHVWSLNGESLVSLKTAKRMWLTGWSNTNAALDCRGDTAIVLRHEPDVIERCTTTCAPVFNAPSRDVRGVVGVLDDGRWIYAASVERLVGVWIEGAQEPFFWRMPWSNGREVSLRTIAVVNGKPALVVGSQLVPLSVPK